MQQDTGKKLLQWNIITGMLSQIVSLAINLISKRVICIYLNVDYLGLQSLYSNFCDVLSFAYFGAGTAMLFSFYAPFARGDKEKLAVIYKHYDNIYKKMTWIVFGVGLATTLLAVFSVNKQISDIEVAITFLTFMMSIVFYNRHMVRSYFIQADQRRYFVVAVTSTVDAVALIGEVLVLKIFRSYEAFVICILLKNLLINHIFQRYLKKNYSYLFLPCEPLGEEESKEIKTNISDMVMYRFGKVLISNTDNIFISRFISMAMVGIYSNYQFIITGITSLVAAFYEAITARVGQMMSIRKSEEQYAEFRFYSFINSWMTGATIICFYFLVQDFIRIWMGSVERLSMEIVVIILVNYYIEVCRYATKMYRESAGLFKNIKQMVLIKGVLNIILSFAFGKVWGLTGIIIATTIASATTLFWYEPLVVYRHFHKGFVNELRYQLLTLVQMGAAFLITGFVVKNFSGEGIVPFLMKAAVCGIVVNLCYLLFFFVFSKLRKGKQSKETEETNNGN